MVRHNSSILLFPKLTIYGFIAGLIFIFFKITIVFLDAAKYFKNQKTIDVLNKLGYIWIKPHELDELKSRNEIFVSERVANSVVNEIESSFAFEYAARKLEADKTIRRKLRVALNDGFINYLVPVSKLYDIACALKKRFGLRRVFLFDKRGRLHRKVKEEFNRDGIVVIQDLSFLVSLIKLFKRVLEKIKLQTYQSNVKDGYSDETMGSNKPDSCMDYSQYEVAYFPHVGIFYGDLFMKDHYYSDDVNSDLHPSKILHISLGESKDLLEQSITFYKKNSFPHIDLNNLNTYSWRIPVNVILDLSKTLRVKLIKDLYKYGFVTVYLLLLSYLRIIYYLFRLERLRNLKISLFGYDIVMPRELLIALSLRKVITFAVQERFINSFVPLHYYIIYDYYVIAGERAKENFLSKAYVGNLLYYGLPRVDNIYRWAKEENNDKYDLIKKGKKIVLVLDYHVERDAFADAQIILANAKNVRRFYLDIIKLADSFQEAVFVIKGKSAMNYENSFLKDVVEQIKMRKNIFFELELGRYDPYYMASRADLAVALYTSLCDEMLAARKPVLIYDFINFPGAFFNYGELPFLVKDFSSLYMMTERILRKGEFIDDNSLDNIIMEYYSNCFNGKVKAKIVNKLEQLLRETKNIE